MPNKELAITGQDADRAALIEELIEADRRLVNAVQRITTPIESPDISLAQARMLFFIISHGPTRMGRLAQLLDVTMPTVTGTVDRMVQRGLVERQADPGDRRVVLVAMTEQGRVELEQLVGVRSKVMRQMLARMTRAEMEQLREAWVVMERATQELVDEIEAEETERP
ncbi:MAG: MarR family transcriptional regulator [Chloroflexota bacterium]|jgi:DNA-binding MarR family transcriptional regulator|nr:MarR family transcriptional regulator [Chloroflexota bacterium]MDP6757906.1 MarR family transcriptional regulator [Chloroflexota bacterium]